MSPSFRFAALACTTLLGTGCGATYAVVPLGGAPRAVATGGPVTITAFANQWDGDPDDLSDYMTPIAVDLYNAGPTEVRVSYVDFLLRDPTGFRYASINPYLARQGYGDAGKTDAELQAELQADNDCRDQPLELGPLYASNGPLYAAAGMRVGAPGGGARMGGGVRIGAPHYSGGVRVGPPGVGRRYGAASVGWHGYYTHGALRGYYGPRFSYWGGPYLVVPGYARWVYNWGPGYYPSRPSLDVINYGLPEGVISPGGRVSGFLYFQNVRTRGAQQLQLSWDAHDPAGNRVGGAAIDLQVVRY